MYPINLRLKYLFPALPVLADRNGEAVVSWAGNGNHSITDDPTHIHSGTNAFKIHATAAGDSSTNHVYLPNVNSPTLVIGNQYCVTFWAYASASITFSVGYGGVNTSGLIPAYSGAMIGVSIPITAASANGGIVIWLSGAADMWIDDITYSQYTDLPVLIEKGMSDPDMYEFFPPIQDPYIDGTMDTQFTSFRRKFMFFVGVVQARADRLGILYWQTDNNRQIDYLTEYQVAVTPNWHNSSQTTGEYSNTWEQDFSGARSFTFELLESKVWNPSQGFPN